MRMMKWLKLIPVFLIFLFPISLTACDADNDMEDAAEEMRDATEEAGEATEDAVEEAGDEIEEATDPDRP